MCDGFDDFPAEEGLEPAAGAEASAVQSFDDLPLMVLTATLTLSKPYPIDQPHPLPLGGDFFLRNGYDGNEPVPLIQVLPTKRSTR